MKFSRDRIRPAIFQGIIVGVGMYLFAIWAGIDSLVLTGVAVFAGVATIVVLLFID